MSQKASQVYQLKIKLEGIRPAIWRRIQVLSTDTLGDLHIAIQRAMGWEESHLHQFRMGRDQMDLDDSERLSSCFVSETKIYYEYDFGDCWKHTILLEKTLPMTTNGKEYPICLAGERACPPEDCGGVWGYADLLEIISDPDHPDYEDRMDWVDEEFDPDHFDPEKVNFKVPVGWDDED